MQVWLPATALSVALTIGVAAPSAHAMGARGGASAGAAAHVVVGFHGHGFRFHHGFGFPPRFFRPAYPFLQPHFNFGAGFVSHQQGVVTGGYGDEDYASDDDYGSYADDDIDNLHFRVQEPFGPGDIGRPPVRAEEETPYMPDGMDPRSGFAPNW